MLNSWHLAELGSCFVWDEWWCCLFEIGADVSKTSRVAISLARVAAPAINHYHLLVVSLSVGYRDPSPRRPAAGACWNRTRSLGSLLQIDVKTKNQKQTITCVLGRRARSTIYGYTLVIGSDVFITAVLPSLPGRWAPRRADMEPAPAPHPHHTDVCLNRAGAARRGLVRTDHRQFVEVEPTGIPASNTVRHSVNILVQTRAPNLGA